MFSTLLKPNFNVSSQQFCYLQMLFNLAFWKELTHYHTMWHFDTLESCIAVENILRKRENACNKQFLLFSQCFLPYMTPIFHFESTLKCRLQMLSSRTGHSKILVFGKW